jgi:hypothetical protein
MYKWHINDMDIYQLVKWSLAYTKLKDVFSYMRYFIWLIFMVTSPQIESWIYFLDTFRCCPCICEGHLASCLKDCKLQIGDFSKYTYTLYRTGLSSSAINLILALLGRFIWIRSCVIYLSWIEPRTSMSMVNLFA